MGIKEIKNDLFMISSGPANIYLITLPDDEITLIDTGYPGHMDKTISDVAEVIGDISKIRNILLTHCHPDHAGNLAELQKLSGAAIYSHRNSTGILSTGKVMPDLKPSPGIMNKLAFKMFIGNKTGYFTPCKADVEISGQTEIPVCGGITAIPASGHSADHTVYLWKRHGNVLFAGDSACTMFGFGIMVGYNDIAAGMENLGRISELDFETACFGHGKPIMENAAGKFRKKWGNESAR